MSANSSFVRLFLKQKMHIGVSPHPSPVTTPHPTYEIWGNAFDAQRLVFRSCFVHFLVAVGYRQTELSFVKKLKQIFHS